MNLFDIDNIFFVVMEYPMSYVEFFGTVAGAIAIWLSAKANVWSWPVGIVNVVLFFFLFYQVQLYPDMLLQVFFFVTNLMGWWRWTHPRAQEADRKRELKVSYMARNQFKFVFAAAVLGSLILGTVASRLHELLPTIFQQPSAFPYLDSFVTVMSIITTFLMIQKKIESWIIWIVVDAVATYMYYVKDIKFVALEYLAFCFIAAFGLWNWMREYKQYAAR